ncbi:MAG: hypothetical protein KAR56_00545 [Thermoplasmata archaeon]|nr:hypothetical protein [Thermoplasmata archaeon]
MTNLRVMVKPANPGDVTVHILCYVSPGPKFDKTYVASKDKPLDISLSLEPSNYCVAISWKSGYHNITGSTADNGIVIDNDKHLYYQVLGEPEDANGISATFAFEVTKKDIVDDRVETIKKGLKAYYPLKGDANDYSGNDMNGTASTEVKYVPGPFGRSAAFTNSGANIKLPNFQRYANTYTLSCWVYLEDYKNIDPQSSDYGTLAGRLAVKHVDGTLQFAFYYDSADKADNQLLFLNSTSKLELHKWHHVLISYNHAVRQLVMYIDRKLDVRHDLSSKISTTDRSHFPAFQSIGGFPGTSYAYASTLNGKVSDVFLLDIVAEKDDANFLGNIMKPQDFTWHMPENEAINLRRNVENTNKNCAPAWWWVIPLVGQLALYAAARCSMEGPSSPPVDEVVRRINEKIGYPAQVGKRVSRSDINLDSSVRVHIDIGGEGVIQYEGMHTGFPDAINLNALEYKSGHDKQPGYEIPNLVWIKDTGWTAFPFADNFADYVTMQNITDWLDEEVDDIARIIKPSGEIALWVAVDHFKDKIEALAKRLNAKVIYNDTDEFHGMAGWPKTTIALNYYSDEL